MTFEMLHKIQTGEYCVISKEELKNLKKLAYRLPASSFDSFKDDEERYKKYMRDIHDEIYKIGVIKQSVIDGYMR